MLSHFNSDLSSAPSAATLACLLHSAEPQLLTPVSVALGETGRVLSRLYFPSRSPDNTTTSSSASAREVYRHQRLGHEKLTWKSPQQAKSATPLPLSPSEA